jgi:hypothetical protein
MQTEDLTKKWADIVEKPVSEAHRKPPVLVVKPSMYRDFFGPLLRYLKEVAQTNPGRRIAVIVPELVERRWYHFLFRHRATLLKGLLILRGGPQVVIITAPWYVRDALKYKEFAS